MRYEDETRRRVEFIREMKKSANAKGLVFGNSGGKDSALVGILCRMACDNTLGLIMPCISGLNYGSDMEDAQAMARQFGIDTRIIDLSAAKRQLSDAIGAVTSINDMALMNIAPRLRMTTLYAVAASENRLVAGTGNRSEGYMGYFTKWGDGACDFNPIADLTVTEVYEFLRFLGAPDSIVNKPPSAGLFEGQTDEAEMGISYRSIDAFLLSGTASVRERAIIEKFHDTSEHKRKMPVTFSGWAQLSPAGLQKTEIATERPDAAHLMVGFVGHSGSGKTTLMEKLIVLMTARGHRVNVIKSTHLDVQFEPEQKDSARFRRAGASEVVLSTPARYMLVHELHGAPKPQPVGLTGRMGPADVTLVEGYKSAPIPKVEVLRRESGQEALYTRDSTIIAVASDMPQPDGLPQGIVWLDLNAPESICDWLFARL